MAPARDAWAPGAIIPGTDYRIVGLLGRGGFGDVFEVEHVHLTRRFAVKVLSRAHAGRGDLVERLKREARSLARLHPHPNLVEVTDLREAADGRAFLVMERLRGRTLGETLRAGRPAPLGLAADVMRQLLRALGAAHRVGLVHRDVKPSNVFLCDDGTVKLLDFGIVKVLTEKGGPQTMPGAAVGTPGYMAPEYIEGAAPDARSDVYSAGVVFWEMLAGCSPFEQGPSGHDLLVRVVTAGVPALEAAGHGDVPAGLRAVVRKATTLRPAERYASADEFAVDLEAALRRDDVPRPARVLKAAPPLPRAPEAAPPPARVLKAAPPPRDEAAPPAVAPSAAPALPRTARARYDAPTAPPPPDAPGDEAADTIRALFDDGAPEGEGCESLRSLFDESGEMVGDDALSPATPDVPSAASPDRVEYAVAFLPTPHPSAAAGRRLRGASRRVVLEPPARKALRSAPKALPFAPTLASAAALAPPPLPEPARPPAPSTAETHVRSLPTPTAVPTPLRPARASDAPAPGEPAGAPRGRPSITARARRSGLAGLVLVAVAGVAWAGARARNAGAPVSTNGHSSIYEKSEGSAATPEAPRPEAPAPSVAPAPGAPPASTPAAPPPAAPSPGAASAFVAAAADEPPPDSAVAVPGGRASLASAPSAPSSPGLQGEAPSPVTGPPVVALAGLAPATPPATLAPSAAADAAAVPAPPAGSSAGESQSAPRAATGAAPGPSTSGAPSAQASPPAAAGPAPASRPAAERPPARPNVDAPGTAKAASSAAGRREGRPPSRTRGKGLGPSHDFLNRTKRGSRRSARRISQNKRNQASPAPRGARRPGSASPRSGPRARRRPQAERANARRWSASSSADSGARAL